MTVTNLPFETTISVIFRDIDAMGHVNNAVFLTYVETARIQFFTTIFGLRDISELSVILAEQTCRYHAPAHYGELLHVGLAVSRLGQRSFELVFAISGDDGRPVASGSTAMVMFDYARGAAIPLSDEVLGRLAGYLVASDVD